MIDALMGSRRESCRFCISVTCEWSLTRFQWFRWLFGYTVSLKRVADAPLSTPIDKRERYTVDVVTTKPRSLSKQSWISVQRAWYWGTAVGAAHMNTRPTIANPSEHAGNAGMLTAIGVTHVVSVGESLITCPPDCDPMYGPMNNTLCSAARAGTIKV